MFGEKIKYVNTSNDTRGVPEGVTTRVNGRRVLSKRSRPCPRSARPRNGMGDKRFPCLTKYRLRTISPTVTTSTRFSAPATSRRCFTILRILRPIKCRPLTLPPTESRQHALEINFSHIISLSSLIL